VDDDVNDEHDEAVDVSGLVKVLENETCLIAFENDEADDDDDDDSIGQVVRHCYHLSESKIFLLMLSLFYTDDFETRSSLVSSLNLMNERVDHDLERLDIDFYRNVFLIP